MNRFPFIACVLVLASGTFACSQGPDTESQGSTSEALQGWDVCGTVASNAVQTGPAANNYYPDSSYLGTTCGAYVVDVATTGTVSAHGQTAQGNEIDIDVVDYAPRTFTDCTDVPLSCKPHVIPPTQTLLAHTSHIYQWGPHDYPLIADMNGDPEDRVRVLVRAYTLQPDGTKVPAKLDEVDIATW